MTSAVSPPPQRAATNRKPKSSPTYSPLLTKKKKTRRHRPTTKQTRKTLQSLWGRDQHYITCLAGGILSCWSIAVLLHSFATDHAPPRILFDQRTMTSSSSSFSFIPQQQQQQQQSTSAFSISHIPMTPQMVQKPPPLRLPAKRLHTPNFGNLEMEFLGKTDGHFTRQLRQEEFDRSIFRKRDPWDDTAVALDDDYEYTARAATDDYAQAHECHGPDFAKRSRPTCNEFHAADMTNQVVGDTCKLLGKGTFNSAFSINHNELVWKTLRYNGEEDTEEFTQWRLQHTRKDAVISERLSSHELIVDIYGYCGIATLSEFLGGHGDLADYAFVRKGPDDRYECMDDDRLDWANEDRPLIAGNNLTALEKIRFSLDLAESMALIHNRPEGVWVHLDVWLEQFLVFEKSDGTLGAKMNDFNNARLLTYDFANGEYCPLYTGYTPDRSNAPEETEFELSGQERDVYRLGTCFVSTMISQEPNMMIFIISSVEIISIVLSFAFFFFDSINY